MDHFGVPENNEDEIDIPEPELIDENAETSIRDFVKIEDDPALAGI